MPENIILVAMRCQAPSYSTTFPGKSIDFGTGSMTQGVHMLVLVRKMHNVLRTFNFEYTRSPSDKRNNEYRTRNSER